MENWKVFKTKPCNSVSKRTECTQRNCPYWHSPADRRRPLSLNYQSILCLQAIENQHCNHDNCHFCKNMIQYLYHPNNYKGAECIYRQINIECINPFTCPYFNSPQEKQQFMLMREKYERHAQDNKGYETESQSDIPKLGKVRVFSDADQDFLVERQVISKYQSGVTNFKISLTRRIKLEKLVQILLQYVCAYLNSEGGVLYYGVTEDGIIKGVSLSPEEKEKVVEKLQTQITGMSPAVGPDKYSVVFKEVRSRKGQSNDLYVAVVSVQKGNGIHFTRTLEAYVRKDTHIVQLTGSALITALRKKK